MKKFLAYSPTHPGFIEAMLRAGHEPITYGPDEDGFDTIDILAYSPSDPHNGPMCVRCGWGICTHCWDNREDRYTDSIEVNDPIQPCPKPFTDEWEYWVERFDHGAPRHTGEPPPRVKTLVLSSQMLREEAEA